MSADDTSRGWTINQIRLATWLLPPAGLVLLWLSRRVTRRERILGTVGIPLCAVVWLAAVVWGLHCVGIQVYEWRGGYVPVLTLSPTKPDYARLEADRARQRPAPVASPPPRPPYWTSVRGPDGDGAYREMPIETNWPADGLRQVWRQPVGGGYAGFVVADGRAFTVEQRRGQEVATAYDLGSGRELWAHGWDTEFKEPLGGDGPRATPAWCEDRVYVLGATGEFRCLDAATGELDYGQLLLASGWLVILCANGDVALVKASPERHEEQCRFPGIQGKTWNYPAIAEGKLLIRNAVEMACYEITPSRPGR